MNKLSKEEKKQGQQAVAQPEELLTYATQDSNFGFELEVLSIVAKSAHKVWHGGTFSDPVEGRPRQFDIRASVSVGRNSLCMPIECKAVRANAPLVVEGYPRTEKEAFTNELQFTKLQESRYPESRVAESSQFSSEPIYRVGEFVGKEIKQLVRLGEYPFSYQQGNEENTDLYKKWSQAISSGHAWIQEVMKSEEKLNAKLKRTSLLLIPFLVVPEGCLRRISYDPTTNKPSQPALVNSAEFYCGRFLDLSESRDLASKNYCITHMHVVTPLGLQQWFERVYNRSPQGRGIDFWLQAFQQADR